MKREWKSGDVAMVTAANRSDEYRAYFDGNTWREVEYGMFCVDRPTSHRPLVVIDPDDREQVAALATAYLAARREGNCDDWMQAALRSLTADPRPDEPQGLGAVVEDDQGVLWVQVRTDGRLAYRQASGERVGRYREYADIAAVKVLSEGVAS